LGGLLHGRTTVLMAPSSVGKTTTLITVMVANVRAGRSILFLNHEGLAKTLVLKMACCCFNLDSHALRLMTETEEGQATLAQFSALLKAQVVFGVDVGSTIEEVRPYIEMKQGRADARTQPVARWMKPRTGRS
jgi:KaiC/GvpD/RAD55 family RecA-like ATPase